MHLNRISKTGILLFILLFQLRDVQSQQLPQYSMYYVNLFQFNPAAAGMKNAHELKLLSRWQWTGAQGAPTTAFVNYTGRINGKKTYNPSASRMKNSNELFSHWQLKSVQGAGAPTTALAKYARRINSNKNSNGNGDSLTANYDASLTRVAHGIAGQFYVDQYGAFRSVQGAMGYAVHLPITKESVLSFGTNLQFSNDQFLPEKAVVLNPSIPTNAYTGGDATYDKFMASQRNQYLFNIDAGFMYYDKSNFIGISARNLAKSNLELNDQAYPTDRQIHYFFTAGHSFDLSRSLQFSPTFMMKYMKPSPLSVEISLRTIYKGNYWFAVGYRQSDAINFALGAKLTKSMHLAYLYDYNTSRFQSVVSGGHELSLLFKL